MTKEKILPKNRIKKFKFRRYHYLAIELRYQGKTYREIAEKLTEVFKVNFRPDRIGHWFAGNGILEAEYIGYAKQENERLRRLVGEELKKLLPRIPKKIEELLDHVDQSGQPDGIALAAVRLLCELLHLEEVVNEDRTDSPLEAYFARLERMTPRNNQLGQSVQNNNELG